MTTPKPKTIELAPCGSCGGKPKTSPRQEGLIYCSAQECPTEVACSDWPSAFKTWNLLQETLKAFNLELSKVLDSPRSIP